MAAGLAAALVVAGLPLMNKQVYQREQEVAAMRDASYDLAEAKGQVRLGRDAGRKRVDGPPTPRASTHQALCGECCPLRLQARDARLKVSPSGSR